MCSKKKILSEVVLGTGSGFSIILHTMLMRVHYLYESDIDAQIKRAIKTIAGCGIRFFVFKYYFPKNIYLMINYVLHFPRRQILSQVMFK